MASMFVFTIQSSFARLLPLAVASLVLLAATRQGHAQDFAGDALTLQVLDASGDPLEGAIVAGRFHLDEPIQLFGHTDADGALNAPLPAAAEHLKLYARAEGYGLVDYSVSLDEQPDGEPVQLHLPQAATISGQLLDGQGKPAAGVRVRPYRVIKFERGRSLPEAIDQAEWIRGLEDDGWPVIEVKASSEPLLPWVETDQEGRFTIDSVAPDQLAGLMAMGEWFAATTIVVRTDDGPAFGIGTERGSPDITVHPREDFKQTLAPSEPISGEVKVAGTGAPVVGATVSPWRPPVFGFDRAEELIAVQTDDSGQYRLLGMPHGEWRIFAAPPEEQPMVAVERHVEVKPVDVLHFVDFTMPRGVTVAGQVTDRNSGQPVPGTVEFYAFDDNPTLRELTPSSISGDRHSAPVDEQGRFEIQVLPGPGIITFMRSTSVAENYRRGIGWDQIDHHVYKSDGNHTLFRTAPGMLIAYNCTQLYEVDVPDQPGIHELNLVVGEERTDVPLQFTAPDGEQLPSSIYYSNATPDDNGFRLFARNSSRERWEEAIVSFFGGDKPRVVQAYDSRYNLAGWSWVSPDDESATIELKPAATLRGRVVREDGSPVAGAALNTPYSYDPTEKAGVLPSQPDEGYYPHTDADGRFEFVGLPPGLPLTVMLDQKDEARNQLLARHYLFEALELEAGEIRDIGEIHVDELREWQRD